MAILPRRACARAASAGTWAAFSSSCLSQTLSTRDTKKLATEAIPSSYATLALRSSSPAT